ncbi:hypothetical protein AAFF_G00041030 [Aldrovandia affinis]|uniref:Uncharacterized protein n=1 Tax=Aldrovandia affinis TaxID=143900 RepID=A0AAD7S2I4_9TELE|nr:hypothetical protein AAFF_G00041030 [Aldrovandia affinis]
MKRVSSRTHMLQTLQLRCQALGNEDNAGYRREFEGLNNVGQELSTRAADLDVNKSKNRYQHILPYDQTRVRLALLNSQLHSDYINANYVPGGASEHDFICTQGPLRNTQVDFWRMVWEQNVRVVVMVTACKENGRVLCEPYWPQERVTVCYGAVQVTTLYQRRGPDSFITTIHLRHMGSPVERSITHYHYPGWADRGIPRNPATLCAFAALVQKHLESIPRIGPTIIHCSAGIGRSGTFVALLWLMQLCVRGVSPDVKAVVHDLRRHRMMLVQNLEQYMLIHNCLMHWLREETSGHRPRATPDSRGLQSEKEKEARRTSQDGSRRAREDQDKQRQHGQRQGQGAAHKLHPGNFLRKLMPNLSQKP